MGTTDDFFSKVYSVCMGVMQIKEKTKYLAEF